MARGRLLFGEDDSRVLSLEFFMAPLFLFHLIFFLFHDQNRFFVIINAMLLSFSTILLDLIKDFSVTIQK
jgi:hypothetical protein